MNKHFRLFGHTISIAVYKSWMRTLGINSRVSKDRHVLFIDVDGTSLNSLIKKLKKLQNERDVGDLFIFKTHEDGKHWHVISPSIFTTKEIVEILTEFNLEYVSYGLQNHGWVLRIIPKDDRPLGTPLYTAFLSIKRTTRARSLAHLDFLRAYYGCFPETKGKKGDKNSNLIIESYSTPNSAWNKREVKFNELRGIVCEVKKNATSARKK